MFDLCISNTLISEKQYIEFRLTEAYENYKQLDFQEQTSMPGAFVMGKINAYQDLYFKFYEDKFKIP